MFPGLAGKANPGFFLTGASMLYRQHVRVGNHVRIGYFLWPFRRPVYIGRRVEWLL